MTAKRIQFQEFMGIKHSKCPRTDLPVSCADIGVPSGTPLLWIMPRVVHAGSLLLKVSEAR